MLLFAYILIISTWIFKILTFFYQVIILLSIELMKLVLDDVLKESIEARGRKCVKPDGNIISTLQKVICC